MNVGATCAAAAGEGRPRLASQLAFAWVTPLMSLGSQRRVEQGDMLDLPPELQPAECRRVLWASWKQVRAHCQTKLLAS